jgi:hypothetical protein
LNNKTLGSSADFTITAPNKLAVVSGTAPANYSQLYLNTDEGKSYLESNTSVYSQGVTLSPNSARMQVSDRSSTAQSSIWVGSTQAGIIADKVVNIERQIKTDRRRTGIQIDDGTGDINGIWIQDGLELPSGYADNALAGAYVRANKNLGVKIGFQGVNPGEKSAFINITNTGSILLSDANGGINIKYMTQMARGIKELIFLSIATTTIDIDLNPTVPSNIYRMNSALNGAKTINVINATVPANSIKEFEVWIPQGATVQSVTWFSGITWISSATMTAGKTNVFTFRTVDGINYVGNLAYAF